MEVKTKIVTDASEAKKGPDTEPNCRKPYDRNEVIFTFPHTTVLYLRCNKNTPSRMKVTIKVPGDSAGYEIPIVKVPEYTLEEIMGGKIRRSFRTSKNFKTYSQ